VIAKVNTSPKGGTKGGPKWGPKGFTKGGREVAGSPSEKLLRKVQNSNKKLKNVKPIIMKKENVSKLVKYFEIFNNAKRGVKTSLFTPDVPTVSSTSGKGVKLFEKHCKYEVKLTSNDRTVFGVQPDQQCNSSSIVEPTDQQMAAGL
jgi:hypothetical protein